VTNPSEVAHEELLQRVLDGEATPEEAARLRQLLAANPELVTRHAELESLFRMLAGAGEIDPPAGWKDDVVRRIRTHEPSGARTSYSSRPALAAWFRRPKPGFALAFVAGVLAGVALFAGLGPLSRPGRQLDGSALPGSMLPADRLGRVRPTDEQRIDFQGGRAIARTSAARGGVLAEIDIASSRPLELELQFDPQFLSVVAFDESPGESAAMQLEAGLLRIEHTGRNRYRLLLHESATSPSALRVRIRTGDARLERELRIRPVGS
jgi:hypothetical protein